VKGIVWIASYPKSGNTWFRIFLSNLLRDGSEPADINALERTPIASSRGLFDDLAGIGAADLLPEEIEKLRPMVYRLAAEEAREQLFMKIHDARTLTADGLPLISEKGVFGAVYIIRNPLDVAVSYAHHNRTDIDTAIARMADETNTLSLSRKKLSDQLPQKVLSWSSHVKSWVDGSDLNVCPIRYEDMTSRPFETFGRAARFCNLPDDPERIKKAIRFSSFETLKGQENHTRFVETPSSVPCFFRKGKSGSWRESLSQKQVRRIVDDHGETMQRFGYLSTNGEITV
jgi:aryl sulfotransferase